MVSVKISRDKGRIDYMTFKTRYEAFTYLVNHGYRCIIRKPNVFYNGRTGTQAVIVN